MIGRLVEDEQIHRMEQYLQQCKPAAFPSAEHAHRFENIIPTEEEGAEIAAQFGKIGGIGYGGDFLEYRVCCIERLLRILGEVANRDVRSEANNATILAVLTAENPQQSGLSRSVLSGDSKTVALIHHQGEVVKNPLAAVMFFQMLDDHHVIGTVWGRGEAEGELLEVGRNLNQLNLLQHLDPALHLPALGCLVAEPLDELLVLLQLLLLELELSLQLSNFHLTLSQILGIVATVPFEFALKEFKDLVYRLIEKALVVADDHQPTLIHFQVVFQPVACFNVQIVGRFVQQHDRRVLHQDLGKGDAHLPAPAELTGRAAHICFREPKAKEHLLDDLLAREVSLFQQSLVYFTQPQYQRLGLLSLAN
ncbi:hypothetical protein SDC9_81304 [bioreactor metagenome]|uniref:Uncharacterized protein n=1 Tax=bioreactor metagenome TaxID=1076179 RepID=A0A644Z283_9ZZZZ